MKQKGWQTSTTILNKNLLLFTIVHFDADSEFGALQARRVSLVFPDFSQRIKADVAVVFNWGIGAAGDGGEG